MADMFRYDGRSLVPDLDQAIGNVMGLVREGQVNRTADRLAPPADVKPGDRINFLLRPENQKILQRLGRLSPEAAQQAVAMAATADQSALQAAARESENASRFYQAFLDTKDPAARNKFLAEKINELQQAGQPTDKLRDLIGKSFDEQTLAARRGVIMAGDHKLLADNGLEAMLAQLKVQGQQLQNLQTAQKMQLDAAAEQRAQADAAAKAEKAATEKADAAKKVEDANAAVRSQAEFVRSQIGEIKAILPKAMSGRPGQLAALVSSTGDTARKAKLIDTLKANIGFDKLQDLRRNSPTGGALGSVTDKELYGLQSVLGNLDATQADADLNRELDKVLDFYDRLNVKAGGQSFTQPRTGERMRQQAQQQDAAEAERQARLAAALARHGGR